MTSMESITVAALPPGFRVPPVPLALFDLDDTLTDRDTDGLWAAWRARRSLHGLGELLSLVSLMRDYRRGTLSGERYMAFHRRRIETVGPGRMPEQAERFFAESGIKHIRPDIRAIARAHRAAGARLVMVTAQNEFIAAPFARELSMDLIANLLEVVNGRVGEARQPLSFREGKVALARAYCAEQGFDIREAAFYSDSANDLPLLGAVGHPIAVAPDARLRAAATAAGWPVIDPAPVKKY